jgi:hypothetical protein
MRVIPSLKSEAAYARDLVKAGIDGAASATRNGASMSQAARSALAPAVLGAAVGVLGVYAGKKGSLKSSLVMGCLVGGVLGFAGAVAWGSRNQARSSYLNASRQMRVTRDARWVEKHPIAYA